MGRVMLKDLFGREDKGKGLIGQEVSIGGWVRTGREGDKGAFAFLIISDGTCPETIQVLVESSVYNTKDLLASGTSIAVKGTVVESPGSGQSIEVKATEVTYVGACDAKTFPMAPKAHSLEYLRSVAHFRSRSNLFSAVFRVRNSLAAATHTFYQTRNFMYCHSPIITASDCEGAGEMFQVSSLLPPGNTVVPEREGPDTAAIEAASKQVEEIGNEIRTLKESGGSKNTIKNLVKKLKKAKTEVETLQSVPTKIGGLPQTDDHKIDYSRDFFGQPTFLTVSGQLQAEVMACSMSAVYTFGPTFRAEESHTSRHLAEFWMIEPEVAFCDLTDLMQLAEDYVRFCCQYVLDHNLADLQTIDAWSESKAKRDAKVKKKGTENVRTYTEPIDILNKSGKFGNVEWGIDLPSVQERYLAEEVYKGPVIVYNYPKEIKAFYMRANEDGKTVAAMDVLCPQIGELIGGSQREERLDTLLAKMAELGLEEEHFSWYLDLRRFGTVPHAGFGLGFERLVMFATGMENIRDVIPFPRVPQSCLF